MAGIVLDKKQKTLRMDALDVLGVGIEDIELRCNTCGETYMLPLSRSPGVFTRTWFVCPKGCNSKEYRKRGFKEYPIMDDLYSFARALLDGTKETV